MDIIENWNLLNARIKGEKPELVTRLFQIHMGAFDDLRKSGHLLTVNGKLVSELAPTIQPQERLVLAGDIGRNLIDIQGELFNKTLSIKRADHFPNCIFIALTAFLENLDGTLDVMFPDKKTAVVCQYDTAPDNNDPLGKLLPLVEECYPWVALSTEVSQAAAPASEPPRFIHENDSNLLFDAEQIVKIDTMRTVFSGTVRRGVIQTGDVLNVVDGSGKSLCHDGAVLSIYSNGQRVSVAKAGQHVDELCLAVEIPAGSYSGVFLVDGDKMLGASKRAAKNSAGKHIKGENQKKNLWSRLFRK